MKEEKFDNIFKDGLQEHKTPLDTNALWEAVASEVVSEKKDKRKAFFFWINRFGGLALMVAVIGLVYWNKGGNPSMTEAGVEPKSLSQTTIEKKIPEKNHELKEVSKVEAYPETETSEQMATVDPELTETFFPKEQEPEDIIIDSREVNSHNANEISVSELSENTQTITALMKHDDGNPIVLKQHAAPEYKFHRPSRLDLINPHFIQHTRTESFKDPKVPAEPETSESKSLNNFGYHLSGYFSSGLIFRELQPRSGEDIDLMNMRNDSEEILESLGGGLKVKVKHKKGLWVASGLDYTQLTERFSYFNQNKRLSYSDTSLTMLTRTIEKKIHNHLKLVSVPIEIGYDFELDNWNISTGAGVLLNLSLVSEGSIMGVNSEFVNLSSNGADIFKKRVGLAYTLRAGMERKIGDHWSVGLSPGVVYYPSSFTQETYNLEQNYWLLLMHVGVSYNF